MTSPKKPIAPRTTNAWTEESDALRAILLDCGLDEGIKWGQLCYAADGKNIAIIQEMKDFLSLMFFKGALLADIDERLAPPGPNSNAARRFEFGTLRDIVQSKAAIERYVREAIDIERTGAKVPQSAKPTLPAELLARFKRDPAFEAAFRALTPGRQRGYALYISGAKSAEARERRIDKYAPWIHAGRGIHDR